ncbi:MAG TPA: peptide chain release factor N(5)-glutamine methyltransferase, partial [Vicinamibacterales bacterium]|nr:peptide chain release factor N(5)-glutamine methyltransferase [Vicinamibacterales bacterium]
STIHDHVAAARRRLREAGISDDEAELDARLLAAHALGWTTAQYIESAQQLPPPAFTARFDGLIARRAAREPFAYIVGQQEFWGLAFEVTPAVLIPRPETELLVELVLARCDRDEPARIADVCTGSGCVAIAVARERPRAGIDATDISEAALDVAKRNAARHDVASRVAWKNVDLLDGLSGPFDVIVANPPYVAGRDRPTLQPEVVDHEPGVALFAGDDGMDVIRRLLPQAAALLRTGGTLLFEFGFGQDAAVADLISSTRSLKMIDLRRDLAGIPRAAVAIRG